MRFWWYGNRKQISVSQYFDIAITAVIFFFHWTKSVLYIKKKHVEYLEDDKILINNNHIIKFF